MKKLPELLSPAGSLQAFEAAIDGGADAIYVGGASFNARINAKNFTAEEMREAVKLAHAYGVKVYQTINIMIYGRETDELIKAAVSSAEMGVDAFIVSDLGAAKMIHSVLPEMPLHASTQMSVHNSAGARLLADHGFSRVVPARELSSADILSLVKNNPLEVEIFIHGAMCVSHSGQCLFSSLVGGRSGNRGLCAQPCRLPYGCESERVADRYPLSLKDMSLSGHVTEIIDSGVASLKIEGRMKSPEYVYGVTKIWRRLLDEGRNATAEDVKELSDLFSRGGFSDGYYTGSVGRQMLGVRSDEDKSASREVPKFNKIQRKNPISMNVSIKRGDRSRLTVIYKDKSVTAEGEVPQEAINAPIDKETVRKCMSKLGDSCFFAEKIDIELDEGLMMPVSWMNALRRSGIAAMEELISSNEPREVREYIKTAPQKKSKRRNVGRFYRKEQIGESARDFFDVITLPLERFDGVADGFVMPAVIFDSEVAAVEKMLEKASVIGAEYAVIGNLGQIALVKKHLPEAKLIADFRFNVANDESMAFFENYGFDSVVLSSELTIPQIRDIKGAKSAVVYGRIPLMTLEKCVIKELYRDKMPKGSGRACEMCSSDKAEMKDRRGFVFPVLREMTHRNIVYNSMPTGMSDRQDELERAGIIDRHFIFTVESADEVDGVIERYVTKTPADGKVRRI